MRLTWTVAAVAAALATGCGMMDHHRDGHRDGSTRASAPGSQNITLSGANEVPPVGSGASGRGTVTVSADCSVTASVTVTGMTATAAHIHEGANGVNGPVAVPLTKTGDNAFAAPPGAKFTEAQCAAYKRGNTYVNVHSAAHTGGEVRAQLRGQ